MLAQHAQQQQNAAYGGVHAASAMQGGCAGACAACGSAMGRAAQHSALSAPQTYGHFPQPVPSPQYPGVPAVHAGLQLPGAPPLTQLQYASMPPPAPIQSPAGPSFLVSAAMLQQQQQQQQQAAGANGAPQGGQQLGPGPPPPGQPQLVGSYPGAPPAPPLQQMQIVPGPPAAPLPPAPPPQPLAMPAPTDGATGTSGGLNHKNLSIFVQERPPIRPPEQPVMGAQVDASAAAANGLQIMRQAVHDMHSGHPCQGCVDANGGGMSGMPIGGGAYAQQQPGMAGGSYVLMNGAGAPATPGSAEITTMESLMRAHAGQPFTPVSPLVVPGASSGGVQMIPGVPPHVMQHKPPAGYSVGYHPAFGASPVVSPLVVVDPNSMFAAPDPAAYAPPHVMPGGSSGSPA